MTTIRIHIEFNDRRLYIPMQYQDLFILWIFFFAQLAECGVGEEVSGTSISFVKVFR